LEEFDNLPACLPPGRCRRVRQFDNWKVGKLENWKNSKLEKLNFEKLRQFFALCAMHSALCKKENFYPKIKNLTS